MTQAEQLARALRTIRKKHPRLSYSRAWELARESLGLCVVCAKPCPLVRTKRCRKHLAADAARSLKRHRARVRAHARLRARA